MDLYTHKGMSLVVPSGDEEITPYFELAATGKFVIRQCTECGLLRFPPGSACPWCSHTESRWKPVSGNGVIHSYIVVTQAIQPGFAAETPYLIVLVELDVQRSVPSPVDAIRIPSNLVTSDFRPESEQRVAVNARVEVVFEPVAQGIAIPKWKLTEELPPKPLWRLPE